MKTRKVFLILTVIALIGVAAAQMQHHPFSEIGPADEDLNFEGYSIQDLSDAELTNITARPDPGSITLRDATGQEIMMYDPDVFELRMFSDLDMSGQSIENFFAADCDPGEVVAGVDDDGTYNCRDVSGEVSGDYVSIDGDSMTGTLHITEDADINMHENDIINIGNLGGDGIVNTGNIASNAVSSSELDETDTYDLSWGNLDIDESDVSASDVGLGSVENIAQSSMGGSGLSWDGTNEELDVNTGNALTISSDNVAVASNSIGSSELVNDDITVSSGSHLTGGGSVSLGESTTLNVDEGSVLGSANDFDSSGNIDDWSGANDLDGSGNLDPASDVDMNGNSIDNAEQVNADDISASQTFRFPVGANMY